VVRPVAHGWERNRFIVEDIAGGFVEQLRGEEREVRPPEVVSNDVGLLAASIGPRNGAMRWSASGVG
jgi:hypothetical protein